MSKQQWNYLAQKENRRKNIKEAVQNLGLGKNRNIRFLQNRNIRLGCTHENLIRNENISYWRSSEILNPSGL